VKDDVQVVTESDGSQWVPLADYLTLKDNNSRHFVWEDAEKAYALIDAIREEHNESQWELSSPQCLELVKEYVKDYLAKKRGKA
jgi:hypothetical protein